MDQDTLIVRTRASGDDLKKAAIALEDEIWSPYGFLSETDSHQKYYSKILDDHADLQLCLVDEEHDEILAMANCVPFSFDENLADLPQEGWDWLVETGGSSNGKRCNMLGALAVSVSENNRSRGFARRMIRELKDLAIRRGFEGLVVPVRPTAKSSHPMVPMSEYVGWTDEGGRSYDPWLRSHFSQGATLIGPCEKSMVVNEHVAFWETWAGQRFTHSGRYTMKGALAPIEIDLEKGLGRYEEANVWVSYAI